MKLTCALVAWMLLLGLPVRAEVGLMDIVTVEPGVYAIVGEKAQRSPQNLANNATFGVIVSADGVILVDPGGSFAGARALHRLIATVTDQPVRWVINTGGQDHRWIGNSYWRTQGAQILASTAAIKDQRARADLQLETLNRLLGDQFVGTEAAYAEHTFEASTTLTLGDRTVEIMHFGAAHTPGDSVVRLPDSGIVFTGDLVYVERLLGIGEQSDITQWPESFLAMAALQPRVIIPGHGHPTDLQTARQDTLHYLLMVRDTVQQIIDKGGDIYDALAVDQSDFAYLEQFEALSGRNIQTAYQQLEWQ